MLKLPGINSMVSPLAAALIAARIFRMEPEGTEMVAMAGKGEERPFVAYYPWPYAFVAI
jgi:hypothetical protein